MTQDDDTERGEWAFEEGDTIRDPDGDEYYILIRLRDADRDERYYHLAAEDTSCYLYTASSIEDECVEVYHNISME